MKKLTIAVVALGLLTLALAKPPAALALSQAYCMQVSYWGKVECYQEIIVRHMGNESDYLTCCAEVEGATLACMADPGGGTVEDHFRTEATSE